MATLFGSVRGLIHDTSTALIDRQIPKKLSDAVTGLVDSGFGIVGDVLKIVQDLSAPSAAQIQPGPQPASPAPPQAQPHP